MRPHRKQKHALSFVGAESQPVPTTVPHPPTWTQLRPRHQPGRRAEACAEDGPTDVRQPWQTDFQQSSWMLTPSPETLCEQDPRDFHPRLWHKCRAPTERSRRAAHARRTRMLKGRGAAPRRCGIGTPLNQSCMCGSNSSPTLTPHVTALAARASVQTSALTACACRTLRASEPSTLPPPTPRAPSARCQGEPLSPRKLSRVACMRAPTTSKRQAQSEAGRANIANNEKRHNFDKKGIEETPDLPAKVSLSTGNITRDHGPLSRRSA